MQLAKVVSFFILFKKRKGSGVWRMGGCWWRMGVGVLRDQLVGERSVEINH